MMLHARSDYNRIQDSEHKIPQDEPVFLLRAQDRTALATLAFWIEANEALPDRDPKAIALAKKHLLRFSDWPVRKTADVPRDDAEKGPK
jgi:hypothetical protein